MKAIFGYLKKIEIVEYWDFHWENVEYFKKKAEENDILENEIRIELEIEEVAKTLFLLKLAKAYSVKNSEISEGETIDTLVSTLKELLNMNYKGRKI